VCVRERESVCVSECGAIFKESFGTSSYFFLFLRIGIFIDLGFTGGK